VEIPAPFKPLTELWSRLNARQRVVVVGAVAAVTVFMGGLIYLGSQPEYGVLFSDLRNTDAQAIVEKLKATSVPYRLSSGGATISVPADRVTEMRLQMAAAGILSGNHVGFDIFDRNGFGATDFTQKVNYQRAIEGELARTLEGMDEVETARVHVTAPRDSVFIDKTEPAKASVVLRMRAGRELSRERTAAVVNLVASAVEGLEAQEISVMDARGRVFAAPDRDDAKTKNGASPLDSNLTIRHKLETETAARIVELLEPVIGEGRVRANVAAEIDFSQVEQTAEKFDPKSATIRSQQTLQESRTGGLRGPGGLVGARANDPQLNPTPTPAPATQPGAQPAPSPTLAPLGDTRNASTTSYEIDKTVTRTLNNGGRLLRLSASVVVDDKKENGKPTLRTAEELKKLQDLVAAAVGMNTQRGDQVVVQSLPFDLPQDATPTALDRYRDLILTAIRYGSIVLAAAVLILFGLRPALRALKDAGKTAEPQLLKAATATPLSVEAALKQESATPEEKPETARLPEAERREPVAQLSGATEPVTAGGPRTIAEIEADLAAQLAAELDDPAVAEVKRASEIKKLLVERSQKNPESIATTLRSWLQEKSQ
jgi:flagellar M-ring protein FliF